MRPIGQHNRFAPVNTGYFGQAMEYFLVAPVNSIEGAAGNNSVR
jgi:hypothetical protein